MHKSHFLNNPKHMSIFEQLHVSQIRFAHSGLSDACIFSSQQIWVFISIFDLSRRHTAELERYYLQNVRDNEKHRQRL